MKIYLPKEWISTMKNLMCSSFWEMHVQLDLAENVHITVNTIARGARLHQYWTEWESVNDAGLESQALINLYK